MNSITKLVIALSLLALSPLQSLVLAQDKGASVIWEQPSKYYAFQFPAGQLPGKLITETKGDDGRINVVIETPAGGILRLDKGRVVKDVREIEPIYLEYQARLAKLDADSADENLALAQWIKDQSGGVMKLAREYEYHLQEVLRIDPKMDTAWQWLGYNNYDGVWERPENMWETHGYVRTRRGLIPKLLAKKLEEREAYEELAAEERSNFKKWQRQIGKVSLGALSQQLVASPSIVPELVEAAKKANDASLRLLYVEKIGDVSSYEAQSALSYFAVRDPDRGVRDRALTLLKQPHYDQAGIAQRVAKDFLTSHLNLDVARGAYIIAELEQTNVILPLINALNTIHVVNNPNGSDPGRLNSSFGGDGSIGFGQNNTPKSSKQVFRNQDVLTALRRLTNADYGFDEARWNHWYSDQFTVQIEDLRGDD